MITDRALAYEATQLGFQVSDEDLADAIRQLMPSLFPDGKFVGKDAYASVLAQNNVTIPRIRGAIEAADPDHAGCAKSPWKAPSSRRPRSRQSFQGKNEKIKIQYVKLTSDKYRGEAQPSRRGDADLFQGEQRRLPDAREEEPGDSDRRPSQDGGSRDAHRRRAAAACTTRTRRSSACRSA